MRTPQEIIDHVATVVSQKLAKNMKCFYTIKVYKNDATSELISRKPASSDFLQDVQQIISINKPDAVIVELYKGSSYKVKEPESTFDINLTGREVSFPVKVEPLGGFDQTMMYSEMRRNFDQQIQNVRELSGLTTSLTVAQMELQNERNRTRELQKELKEAEEYILQLEKDMRSRPQLGGSGGLNLIELGSFMLEGVLRRNPKLIAGMSGLNETQVKGLFNDQKELPSPQGNATASVKPQDENKQLSERDQMRVQIIEQIAGFLRQLQDYHLRAVYELMFDIGKDLSLIEKFKQIVKDKPEAEENKDQEGTKN